VLAAKVSKLVFVVVAWLKDAVTPLGGPVAVRATLAAEPFELATSMMLLTVAPPTRRVSALSEDEILKPGSGMVNAMVVVLTRIPEVPVTVSVQVPGSAIELGVSVNVLLLVVLGELKVAVTPLGTPDTAKLTALLKPF
jgi:hypothetical protein